MLASSAINQKNSREFDAKPDTEMLFSKHTRAPRATVSAWCRGQRNKLHSLVNKLDASNNKCLGERNQRHDAEERRKCGAAAFVQRERDAVALVSGHWTSAAAPSTFY